jgi:hypothetical protein
VFTGAQLARARFPVWRADVQTQTRVVYVRHGSFRQPVMIIVWKDDQQVVVRLRQPHWESHLTLHRRTEKPILLTLSMKDKPPSVHDEARVQVARRLGYEDPERHGNYVTQQELHPTENVTGFPLVGWAIDLASVTDKRRYRTQPLLELEAPAARCLVSVYLSTAEFPINSDEPYVATPLGDLYFRFEVPGHLAKP